MNLLTEIRELKHDALKLQRNFNASDMVFKSSGAAERQIRRIIGHIWALKDLPNGTLLLTASNTLFHFVMHEFAHLGSYAPEDWAGFVEQLRTEVDFIVSWCVAREDEILGSYGPETERARPPK